MTHEKIGKVSHPDDMPEPRGWPDSEEELPPRDDDAGGKVPFPPEIEDTPQGHPNEPHMDDI